MSKLPLAVDIADKVIVARRDKAKIDVPAASEQLRVAHPEADSTAEDIADAFEATQDQTPPSQTGQ